MDTKEMEKKVCRLEFYNEILTDDFLINSLSRDNFVHLCKDCMNWYDNETILDLYFVVCNEKNVIEWYLDPVKAGFECAKIGGFVVALKIALITKEKYYRVINW